MPESRLATLPDGTEGVPYRQKLEARGGVGRYTWAMAPGGGQLPLGLRLSSDGAITGTPAGAGTSSFTVEVRSGARTARLTVSMEVKPQLTVLTTALPVGIEGASYHQELQARGGSGHYTWGVAAGAGDLPSGLTLSPDGTIRGTPAGAGTSTFAVEVTSGAQTAEVTVSRVTVEVPSAPEVAQRGLSITVQPRLAVATTAILEAIEGLSYRQRLEAEGGDGGYSWSLAPGSEPLPIGLSLSPDGEVSGAPATAGSSTCTLEVTSGVQVARVELSITVRPRLAVETTSLPEGIEGAPYRTGLEARGGEGDHTWTLAPGSDELPSGLSLSPDGEISGTPTVAGAARLALEVTSGVQVARVELSITVRPRLAVETTSLPRAEEGVPYWQRLAAGGGDGRYAWALAAQSDPLPPGLSVSANGELGGTPEEGGASTLTVEVTSGAQTARIDLLITVEARLEVATTQLPPGTEGVSYAHKLEGRGGDGRYAWVVGPASGRLPLGLELLPEGWIRGTPQTAGRSSFTVHVTSGSGARSAHRTLSIAVHAKLAVVTTEVPGGAEGVRYRHQLEARGGDGRYVWSLTAASGRLPPGLRLSPGGVIVGTPGAGGTSNFTIEVTSGGQAAQCALSIPIQARLVTVIDAMPPGTVGVPYRQRLHARGGDGGHRWAAGSGRLPPGLVVTPEGEIIGTPTAAGAWDFGLQVTSGAQCLYPTLSIAVQPRPSRPGWGGVRPSARGAAVVLGSLGIAAVIWLGLARALLPAGEPPSWYQALAGAWGGFYEARYPALYVIFGLLCPIVMLAAGVHAWIRRAAPELVGARPSPAGVTPWAIPGPRGIEHGASVVVARSARALLRSAVAALLGAASALHLVYGLGLAGTSDRIGLALALATCVLAVRVWHSDSAWEFTVLGLFGSAQAAIFVGLLAEAPLPLPSRSLAVLTASLYLALPVVGVGVLLPKPKPVGLIRLAAAVGMSALAVEAVASLIVARRGGMPELPASIAAGSDYLVFDRGPRTVHPELGPIPVPNSVTETIYPDDPRNYFPFRSRASWVLSHQPTSEARLERSREGAVVVIDRADAPTPRDILLTRYGLALEQGSGYVLRFRMRATRERPYQFAVSMARPPGDGLGLTVTERATTTWTSVTRLFTARLSEDSARIDFRLGGDTADVYLSDLSVTRTRDGARVDGGSGTEYYVPSRWNSRGCRAPDYSVPAGPGGFRIVVLGDSYTAGRGVRTQDMFTSVMERRLGERASTATDPTRFEVLGCGVTGFSTRDERLYYQERLRAYEPDLVLLVMVANDDRRDVDESRLASSESPARWEYLLRTGYLLRSGRRADAGPDFSEAIEELAQLHALVRRDGSDLGVVLFTNREGRAWDRLTTSATDAARELGVPILDLRSALLSDHAPADLTVHPIDDHPNEIAHRIAGERIVEWLEELGLVGGNDGGPP